MNTNNQTRASDVAALFPVPSGALDALHVRLVAAAERDGLIDVAYRTVDTPVGTLLLAATEIGLVRVAYQREDFDAVLDAGPCPGLPTTVVDLAVTPPAIVRLGLGDLTRLGLAAAEAGPF